MKWKKPAAAGSGRGSASACYACANASSAAREETASCFVTCRHITGKIRLGAMGANPVQVGRIK
ncbi:hypothetical protein QYH69_19445 [Paraburkholderia sp. SARCC-3016]|uniref:hypothetical protein n=1 Tax=Paraburkholderia sp. SARCC-3016 TaxID=3058611 RepID=UPI0028097C9A|nr:hypothetical protein [Paraburkholderia sp. SARCC-3016]MDQ7979427.1 hypothetical protein [Paraburkholderia sp. SARCC-3016]